MWFFTVGQALACTPLVLDVGIADRWFIIGSTLVGLLLPTRVITRVTDGPAGVRRLWRQETTVRHRRARVRPRSTNSIASSWLPHPCRSSCLSCRSP